MTTILRAAGALGLAATLAACGATPTERALTGALAGGAIAEATDGDLLTGVLAGGAIGGIAPCVANPNAAGCY